LPYLFEDYALDTDRRELRRGGSLVPVEPQVFDLLEFLIRNRERVVSRDDLVASVWQGRIVSESALSTRINALRAAIGDSGEAQRLIKTLPRKGIRFVGVVREQQKPQATTARGTGAEQAALTLPDKPSIAVLPFTNMDRDPEQEYFADGVAEEIVTALSRCNWLFVIARNSSFTYKVRPWTSGRSAASSVCAMSSRAACGAAGTGFGSSASSSTQRLERIFGPIGSKVK
jgi:adenylate cyclase